MRVQVLVSTMNQNDHSLLKKMNIHSDAIVGNQCDRNQIEEFRWNNHEIKYLNFAERGVGLNRNNSLMRSDADICLFADDDVVYYDNYVDLIKREYEKHPEADVIIFNFKESRNGEPLHDRIRKSGYVKYKGVSSFATFMITIKNKSIKKENITFHRMFGGGAEYSHGEDTIFMKDCVSHGLKIYATTSTLGVVKHNESTWFKGFNKKYFEDKGVLLGYMYPKIAKIISIYHIIKHKNIYIEYGLIDAIKSMWMGINRINKK